MKIVEVMKEWVSANTSLQLELYQEKISSNHLMFKYYCPSYIQNLNNNDYLSFLVNVIVLKYQNH